LIKSNGGYYARFWFAILYLAAVTGALR